MQFELLVKLIAAAWLAVLFTNYNIPFLDSLLEWVVSRVDETRLQRVGVLLTCAKCFGFWVGIYFALASVPIAVSLALLVSLLASLFNRYAT